jgi:hypothetical protein
LLFIICKLTRKSTENFTNRQGKYCPKCEDQTLGQCMNCSNCGWYIDGFESGCIGGDTYSPYKRKVDKWYHNDPYYRALISNDNDYDYFKTEPVFNEIS